MEAQAAAEWWESAKALITAYTGLSPAAFFTAVAVAAALYLAVSGLFSQPPPPPRRSEHDEVFQPLPPPVQVGEVTEEELKAYDGSDPKKPLLMAIKGQIYDVTRSRMFYGPGGPYALFAGKDASRALAKMSFEPNDLTGDISGLGSFELEALQEWEYKFMSKYVKVGTVKTPTVPVTEGDAADPSQTSERAISTTESNANHGSGPNQNGDVSHGDAAEKPKEIREAEHSVTAAEVEEMKHKENGKVSHEDAAEKPKEIKEAEHSVTAAEVEVKHEENGNVSHGDAAEKPKEIKEAEHSATAAEVEEVKHA